MFAINENWQSVNNPLSSLQALLLMENSVEAFRFRVTVTTSGSSSGSLSQAKRAALISGASCVIPDQRSRGDGNGSYALTSTLSQMGEIEPIFLYLTPAG